MATARLFLAVSALAAIYMDPTQLGHAPVAYGLLGIYLIHGVMVITLLRRRKQSTLAFRLLVHGADIVWPAFISVFAEGPRSPFFLFFFFVLAAAAISVGTLGDVEHRRRPKWFSSGLKASFCFICGSTQGKDCLGMLMQGLQINVTEFEPKRLFMLSIYLLVVGLLLGYLAEQQRHLRAEKAVVTGMLAKVRVEAGLTRNSATDMPGNSSRYVWGKQRLLMANAGGQQSQNIPWRTAQRRWRSFSDFTWLGSGPRDASRRIWRIFRERCTMRLTMEIAGL